MANGSRCRSYHGAERVQGEALLYKYFAPSGAGEQFRFGTLSGRSRP
jgi:hypothetical protein